MLDRIYVDDKRHWAMPSVADAAQAQTMPIKEISLFKTGAWAGKMESKYTYAANYEENGAFGFASDTRQLGAWTVLGNYEYYNDGPHKQDLTALSGTMTHHFGRNHYNGTRLRRSPRESSGRRSSGRFCCSSTPACLRTRCGRMRARSRRSSIRSGRTPG